MADWQKRIDICENQNDAELMTIPRNTNMNEKIDWDILWRKALARSSWAALHGYDVSFWDRRARKYDSQVKLNDRSVEMISTMELDPESAVLDIGGGPGTLAIPLASMVKQVTVVDPSMGMLSCLRENARAEGLSNIRCINCRWEEIVPFVDLDVHDVVVASYSLAMPDLRDALYKMNQLARRAVYLFTFAGKPMWDYDQLWPIIHGSSYYPGPDYIYIYNILHDMGIYANVEITKIEHKQRFSNLEEAVTEWSENLCATSPQAVEAISSFLEMRLVCQDGALFMNDHARRAMIWWRPEPELKRD